jgi:hypothetical protein
VAVIVLVCTSPALRLKLCKTLVATFALPSMWTLPILIIHALLMAGGAWRPCKQVQNSPLALCDRRTISESDVIRIDKVLPIALEEETRLFFKEHHKWFWRSQQRQEKLSLFVEWDSLSDGNERGDITDCHVYGGLQGQQATVGVFHAACTGSASITGEVPRESVEVRLVVVES